MSDDDSTTDAGMDGADGASDMETDESGGMADEGSDGDDMGEMLDPIGALAEVRTLDDGSLQVYSEIVIEATPEQIWEVLTDFEAMPEWSDTFQGLTGDSPDYPAAVLAHQLVQAYAWFNQQLKAEVERRF